MTMAQSPRTSGSEFRRVRHLLRPWQASDTAAISYFRIPFPSLAVSLMDREANYA
jgi:hypothetical protein